MLRRPFLPWAMMFPDDDECLRKAPSNVRNQSPTGQIWEVPGRPCTKMQIPNTSMWMIISLSSFCTGSSFPSCGGIRHSCSFTFTAMSSPSRKRAGQLQRSPGHWRKRWCRRKGGREQYSKSLCRGNQGHPCCCSSPTTCGRIKLDWVNV